MSTQYMVDPSDMLVDLARVLAFERGIRPVFVGLPAVQCEWCGDEGAITTVRVNGRPRPDVLLPVELELVCGVCAPPLIDRARAEQDGDDDLVIEVSAG